MLNELARGVRRSRMGIGWLLVAGSCVQLSGCGGDDDSGGTAGKGGRSGGHAGASASGGHPSAGTKATGGSNGGQGHGGAGGDNAGRGASAGAGGTAGHGSGGTAGHSAGGTAGMIAGTAGLDGEGGASGESGAGGEAATAGAAGTSEGGVAGAGGALDCAWRITELRVDGYPDSYVTAVNANGTYVTGRVWDHTVDPNDDVTATTLQGVRWNDATPSLLVQSAWSHAWPVGISNDGSVIAGFRYVSFNNLPFYWNEGGPHDLSAGSYTGSGTVIVSGISGDGLHVVGGTLDPNAVEALVWDSGTLRRLPWPTSVGDTIAAFANAADHDGAIIAGYGLTLPSATAVRWSSSGADYLDPRVLDLGTPNTFALDISDDGKVIVGYEQGRTPWAIRWLSNVPEYLPAPAAATACAAYYTNGDGSIIVGGCGPSSESGWLLWHGTGYVTLESVLSELGIDVSAYPYISPADISADGTTLIANTKVGDDTVGLRIRIDGATLGGSSR